MSNKTTAFIFWMLFLVGVLFGKIQVPGTLVIPTATGETNHKAMISFLKSGIEIETENKLFQPFNQFDAPRFSLLKLPAKQIRRVIVSKNEIAILTGPDFYRHYRNLFFKINIGFLFGVDEDAIIFTFDATCPDAPRWLRGISVFKRMYRRLYRQNQDRTIKPKK